MLDLSKVTLVGIDCVNVDRLIKAINICTSYAKFGDIKLLTTIPTNYEPAVKIPHIGSIQEYSKFMIRELHNYVNTEYALIIQWDAFILNPQAWTDEFYSYDYVGAPWWFENRNVGNGGFSLRSRAFIQATSKLPIKNYHPEDQVCCRTYRTLLEQQGIKFAPEALAARFSLEGNQKYGRTWTNQFGFHDLDMTDISNWKPNRDLHIIYRYCDKRPETYYRNISKVRCLENFISYFGDDYKLYQNMLVLLDNCNEKPKILQDLSIPTVTTLLGNSQSFSRVLDIALDYPDNDYIYLVEDDYLHREYSHKVLLEGLEIADFVSLYDHPDKYMSNSPNPLVKNGGESTKVYLTKSTHWKETNSTTMTFACKVETLKKYRNVMKKYLNSEYPRDFEMWREILKDSKLITPIPGYSTHCHSPWITPLIDWDIA